MSKLIELARRVRPSRHVLFFTGAGMSTESGLADFRGPQGLWKRWRPVYYQEFLTDPAARRRHWDYKLETWPSFQSAQPNPGHEAIVRLEKLNHLHCLVTQNIDGLHQKAGNSPQLVIELHGTNLAIECIDCGQQRAPAPIFKEYQETRTPPLCSCGGLLKPATVSFGQSMPAGKLQSALENAERCDLAISIGSSLEVRPAASVPLTAQQKGAFYAIINRGPTAHDHIADLRLEGNVSRILPDLVELLGSA